MSTSVVHLDIQANGVAVVRIDRPEAKNALNAAVRQQLAEHFRALSDNPEVRAVVLTGERSASSPALTSVNSPRPAPSRCTVATPNCCGKRFPVAPSR